MRNQRGFDFLVVSSLSGLKYGRDMSHKWKVKKHGVSKDTWGIVVRTHYLVAGTWLSGLIYGKRQTDKRSIKPAAELHSVVQNCLSATMPPFSDTESQYILIYCGHCNDTLLKILSISIMCMWRRKEIGVIGYQFQKANDWLAEEM